MFVLFCLSACVFLTKSSAHKQRSRGDKEQRLTAIPNVFVLDEFQESRQPLKDGWVKDSRPRQPPVMTTSIRLYLCVPSPCLNSQCGSKGMYVFKSVMCCSCFCDTKVKDGTRTQNTFLTKQLAFEEETHSKLCSALASEPRIHNFQSDTFLCKIPILAFFYSA